MGGLLDHITDVAPESVVIGDEALRMTDITAVPAERKDGHGVTAIRTAYHVVPLSDTASIQSSL